MSTSLTPKSPTALETGTPIKVGEQLQCSPSAVANWYVVLPAGGDGGDPRHGDLDRPAARVRKDRHGRHAGRCAWLRARFAKQTSTSIQPQHTLRGRVLILYLR